MVEIDNENLKYATNCELLYKTMGNFLHDITKVNKIIDKYSKAISKSTLTKKDASKVVSICQLSDFISKRIELYRLESNSEIIMAGKKRVRDAYQLWDIYRHIFEDLCKENELSIDMKVFNKNNTEEYDKKTTFCANDSITVLPFLIIDNAVKYSREKSTIKINFFEDNGFLKEIKVSSSPSYIIMEDPAKLIERGYRGANNSSKSSGSGLGLAITKQICDYNNIDLKISIDSDENGKQVFVVILKINE